MERLMRILGDLHPEVNFGGKEKLIEGGILNSLDIVSIVTDINDQYGIAIDAGDIVKENFETPEEIKALIVRRGGEVK